MMRVAHISKSTGIAGSERHLLSLLPGLRKRGVDTRVLVIEDPRRPASAWCHALEERGEAVERVPIYAHLDPGLVRRLVLRLSACKPDVVHTHLLHADIYGLAAARRARVPHAVSSRHNEDAFRRNPLIKWLNRRAMRHAECVIAVSGSVARFVSEVEGVPAQRVVTIHYGLDVPSCPGNTREIARSRLGIAGNRDLILIGFVGRLVRQKGVDLALHAFAKARRGYPQSRLVIVGDGPLRRDLEAQTRRLGLKESIIQKVNPRLCREDSQCLTYRGVTFRVSDREPLKVKRKETLNERCGDFTAYQVGMQISSGFHTEVSS